MATKNDRIAQLKASGMPNGMIASLTAVSPAYVSQLCALPEFQQHVAELTLEMAEEETSENKSEARELGSYKDKLAAAEHELLDHLVSRVHSMDDRTALSALVAVGSRRDAIHKAQQTDKQLTMAAQLSSNLLPGTTLRMVELTIPAISAPELRYGANNEVVGIGERSTTPMPAATLLKMLEGQDKPAIDIDDYEDAQYA